MNFSTDVDLVRLEPNVFGEVVMMSQQRLRVTDGAMSGTTMTSAGANFVAAGVDAGSVVLVGGVAYEVVSRTDANTLVVSLPRVSDEDPAVVGLSGTGLEVVHRTFALQAAIVRGLLLRLAGIDEDGPEGGLTGESVVSGGVMSRLEAMGTLELVYWAAAAVVGENEGVRAKAERWRKAFNETLRGATVWIDRDGDGVGDERLSLGTVRLSRV